MSSAVGPSAAACRSPQMCKHHHTFAALPPPQPQEHLAWGSGEGSSLCCFMFSMLRSLTAVASWAGLEEDGSCSWQVALWHGWVLRCHPLLKPIPTVRQAKST